MEGLNSIYPEQLDFNDPSKAILSTRRTIAIKPQSGNSVSSASSQDIVQFRLPNTGVLDVKGCYLKYNINPTLSAGSSDSTNTFQADTCLMDPYCPSAGCFRRMVVKASDGTEISNVSAYNRYCSIVNRFCHDKDYHERQGAMLQGTPFDNANTQVSVVRNATAVDEGGSTNHTAGKIRSSIAGGAMENQKRFDAGFTTNRDMVHQFEAGILDHKKDYMLPLFALGSGMMLELNLADAGEVFRVCPENQDADDASLALNVHPRSDATVSSYTISNIELVCDLVFYPSSLNQAISQKLCNGLSIVVDRVRNQTNTISQSETTTILNEHARSVSHIIAGLRNTGDINNTRRFETEYYDQPDGSNAISKIQFSVGAEMVLANEMDSAPQRYIELEKALKVVYGDKFKMSNSVGRKEYLKAFIADSAGAGTGGSGVYHGGSLFGVNLSSHPDLPDDVLSGKSSSAGTLPISLNLTMGGTPSNTQLDTFVVSQSVVQLLSDGSVLVNK